MKTIRYNLFAILAFISAVAFAQTKTLDKSYKVNSDAEIKINSSHTNIVVDYWDKNEVRVEAILDTEGMDEEARKKLTEDWKPEIKTSAGNLEINSGPVVVNWERSMQALEEPLAQLPEMLGPLMENLGPMLESLTNNPLPPEFAESMGSIKFDHEAYRKDGDKYLEKFEKEMEGNFGQDFEKAMEEWAEQFENNPNMKKFEMDMEVWGENFGKDMEAWGEEFGKKMEAWGENFGQDMEQWAQQFEADMATGNMDPGNIKVLRSKDGGAKKTLKLNIPRNSNLNLDVRHGDVKLSGTTKNLKADLSHSRFTANTISGKQTEIKVAYTPVKVKTWDYGVLSARYVKDLKIDKARSIKLDSKSSDILFNEIGETGILSGSFGKLKIGKLHPGFKNLDVSLENSDMELSLPDAAYNFTYNGTKSKIKTPSALKLKSSSSYDNESLNGYNKTRDANASVTIKASFSDVLVN
ncbi:hypothetical protein [Salegentibacter sp.]|uniref:hypothetical protein n=1 Tax=Salegentibacter sp. TaxID=1903072 RepID=UPI0035663806